MANLRAFQRVAVIDMTDAEFQEEFDLVEVKEFDPELTYYAFVVSAEEADENLPKVYDYFIYMNEEKCNDDNVYTQVLAHEYGHIFNQVFGFEDSEDAADDFAYDVLSETGIPLDVFAHWADVNDE